MAKDKICTFKNIINMYKSYIVTFAQSLFGWLIGFIVLVDMFIQYISI